MLALYNFFKCQYEKDKTVQTFTSSNLRKQTCTIGLLTLRRGQHVPRAGPMGVPGPGRVLGTRSLGGHGRVQSIALGAVGSTSGALPCASARKTLTCVSHSVCMSVCHTPAGSPCQASGRAPGSPRKTEAD